MSKVNYSIHPRNYYLVDPAFKRGNKSNTSKPTKAKNFDSHEGHVLHNPKDVASAKHFNKRKEKA